MSDLRLPDLNRVTLAGRLTRDPELRFLPSGMPLCKLGLAVSRVYKKDGEKHEEKLFINVTVWGKSGEYCNEHMKKGYPVLVEGRLRANDYTDKEGNKRTGFEISAERVQQLSWENHNGGRSEPEPEPAQTELPADVEEDIPF